MTKQELCQLLENRLGNSFNQLEINSINNYLWPFFTGNQNLGTPGLEDAHDDHDLNMIIEQLRKGKPIQYIIGNACFYGLELEVNNDVLIPRPETEELVLWIIKDTNKSSTSLKVLDIGTGSGCIAIVLKKYQPHWVVNGLDISEKALRVAINNAKKHQLDINFFQMDFMKDKKDLENEYDIIVSNPPYVSIKEMNEISNSVLSYEPHVALFAKGDDPLIFYREIAGWAKARLKRTGSMYFEMNEFLSAEIMEIFKQSGYTKIAIREDLQKKQRMLKVQF